MPEPTPPLGLLCEGFAGPGERVALLLVCRGLEAECVAALQEDAPGCRCLVLPGGGEDGEAAVGKVLLAAPPGGDRLWPAVASHAAVQSAFALLVAGRLAPGKAGLDALAAALEASPHWASALELWSERQGCAGPPESFRVSAVRDGPHEYSTPELAMRLGGAVIRRMGWRVSLESYAAEVFAVVSHDVAVVGLPLFPEWRGAASGLSQRSERFFVLPREVRPYLSPDAHTSVGCMRLRPSTCNLLLRLAGVGPGCRVLDCMGGVGTIAIEAAVRWPRVAARSSDISQAVTEAARVNLVRASPLLAEGSAVEVLQEDARRLSAATASVDAVVVDVPFGNRNRNVRVAFLVPEVLPEVGRVLRPGGRVVLLMTRAHARQLGVCLKKDAEPLLRQAACRNVVVGGWPAAIVILERTEEEWSEEAEEEEAAPAVKRADGEHCECVLEAPSPAGGRLSDVLLGLWPDHLHSESMIRKVMRRGRVWLLGDEEGAPARQPWWNDTCASGQTVLFVPDYPKREPYEEPVPVLHEGEHAAVVLKPPGLRLFGGIRTLANILAAREKGILAPSDCGDALPAPVPVHFVEGAVCGCVLVAKSARAALQLSRQPPRRRLRAVLHGDAASSLRGLEEPWQVHRVCQSLRFGALTEASRDLEGDLAPLRKLCASLSHAIIGDTEFGGAAVAAVRRNCLYLAVEGLSFVEVAPGGAEVAVSLGGGQVERFEKLFATEALTWRYVSEGRITSDYVARCVEEWMRRLEQQGGPMDDAARQVVAGYEGWRRQQGAPAPDSGPAAQGSGSEKAGGST